MRILFFLFFVLPVFGQKTLLWELTGQNLTGRSYVFGTLHAACPENIQIGDSLKMAFDHTEQLYLEIDMDNPAEILDGLRFSNMNDGLRINELVSAPEYSELTTAFKDISGMNLAFFKRKMPLMLMSLLLPKITNCTPAAWESKLMNLSQSQKEPILGLESVKEQLSLLHEIPYKTQALELLDMLKNFDQSRLEFEELTKAYQSQDLAKIEGLIVKSEINPEVLLYRRNQKWADSIAKISQSKPTIYAVGAGHLVGPKGLLSLLRNHGLTVKPITNN